MGINSGTRRPGKTQHRGQFMNEVFYWIIGTAGLYFYCRIRDRQVEDLAQRIDELRAEIEQSEERILSEIRRHGRGDLDF